MRCRYCREPVPSHRYLYCSDVCSRAFHGQPDTPMSNRLREASSFTVCNACGAYCPTARAMYEHKRDTHSSVFEDERSLIPSGLGWER